MELSPRQKTARLAVALAVLAALALGTAWGDDDNFPFGPFRMYSVRNDPNGTVKETRIRGTSIDGRELRIPFRAFGLRRPEVDRQLWWFADDDRLAEIMVQSYENSGSRPALSELRIIREVHQLRGGRPVGSFEMTLGVWRAGD